jgi:hypothetical protein
VVGGTSGGVGEQRGIGADLVAATAGPVRGWGGLLMERLSWWLDGPSHGGTRPEEGSPAPTWGP